ncbi:MAG: hypothetical protein NT074_07090 [Methanomicrobiales archaeon]|nr:hypothetical protein [Methanomicrobiales archaeon]
MRAIIAICAFLVTLTAITVPVAALVAGPLDIAVYENGDACITFRYELSFFETFAVYLRIADPSAELKAALEKNFNKPVSVISAGSGMAQFTVFDFASVYRNEEAVTYTTPSLSFAEAARVIDQYWFRPLITLDLSPSVTTVRFPDGYTAQFNDAISIPSLTHTVPVAEI